ncbi:MAG: hypothetical protein ACOZB3_09520 [Calditrichota bacterium]
MKTAVCFKVLIVAVLLAVMAIPLMAQDKEKPTLVFGVKPGMLVQSSYFGLAYEKFQPYIGVDWVGLAVKTETGDAAGSVIIPHLGAKYYVKPSWRSQHVAPYFTGDWFFSIAAVDIDAYESEEEEMVKQLLEFWGLGIGFGAEYYFSEHFCVGGEYGLRYMHNGVDEHKRTEHYQWGDYTETVNDEFSFAFRMTYAVISLGFRF